MVDYNPVGWQDGGGPNTYPGLLQMDQGLVDLAAAVNQGGNALPTIAALKADTVSGISTGATRVVLGYYAPNDGGGGLFRYNSTSSATDNGGTTIAPNVGSGRWERQYTGRVNVKWFGARGDNTTNDLPAAQAAHDYIVNTGQHNTLYFPYAKYKFNGQFYLDIGYVALESDGALINALSLPSGNLFYITTTTVSNPGASIAGHFSNTIRPIRGFEMIGPLDTSDTVCMFFEGTDIVNHVGPYNTQIENVYMWEFGTGILLGDNTSLNNFVNLHIEAMSIGLRALAASATPSGYRGERYTIIGGAILGCNTYGIETNDADWFVSGTSFDYNKQHARINNGRLYVANCHIEAGGRSDHNLPLWHVSGSNSMLQIKNSDVSQALGGPYIPRYVQCDTNAQNGGVWFDGCLFTQILTTGGTFANSGAPVWAENSFPYNCVPLPPAENETTAYPGSVTVANTTTETNLHAISAKLKSLQVGQTYRITADGTCGVTSAQPTLNFRVRIGTALTSSDALAGSAVVTPVATATSTGRWHVEFLLTIRSIGATGTAIANGKVDTNLGTAAALNTAFSGQASTVTVDTTVGNYVAINFAWGTANASNTLTVHNVAIEKTAYQY